MRSENELQAILETVINAYKTVYGSELVSAYLYGSYARGDCDSDSESDIDIVAIVKGNRMSLQQALKKVWDIAEELEIKYERVISPTVIPCDEFETYKEVLPYYRNIEKEGVKLFA